MVAFYELQLILLISSCLVFLLLEHHASSRKRAAAATARDYHADRLENGRSIVPVNALAQLTRQYLLVYAIVMGGLISHPELHHADVSLFPAGLNRAGEQVLTGSRVHTFTPYTVSSTGCPKGWLLSCSSPVSCLRV